MTNTDLITARISKTYATVVDSDLITDRPDYSVDRLRLKPRLLAVGTDGDGDLVVSYHPTDDTKWQATLHLLAGMVIPVGPRWLIESGSTVTNLMVFW